MHRRSTIPILVITLLAASTALAQPLPCADAYAEIAEELIASIGTAELPAATGAIMELLVRSSIFTANSGNLTATLNLLGSVETWIGRLVAFGRLDPVVGESLIALVEQARAVLASCTATPPLFTLNCRSGDGENTLLWLTPPGSHVETRILYRTDTYPQGPSDPAASPVGVFPGPPDAVGSAIHDNLANDLRYYYAAWTVDASGEPSPGRLTFGRPQSDAGSFRWSYTAGGIFPPSIGQSSNSFMTASSTGFVFALEATIGGGTWSAGTFPGRVPSPATGRPISLPPSATPTGEPWVVISDRGGQVHAVNELTGETVWTSPRLGRTVEASVCGTLTSLGGVDDVLMVGTVDGSGGSRFVGLDLADGSLLWSFDNGGGTGGIGAIRNMCAFDYGRSAVYFTSEPLAGGSQDTVWALSIGDGSATKLWSAIYPNVNTSVVRSGDVIYAGTSLGEVVAIDAVDGSARWSSPYATGDGPVEGFIFPGGAGRLAFSTSNLVHLIQDDGTSAAEIWQPAIGLPGPNVPLLIGSEVLVADAEGRVYDLDAGQPQPPVAPFADFGDPARPSEPGLPFFNTLSRLYGVGTSEGVLYVVEAP